MSLYRTSTRRVLFSALKLALVNPIGPSKCWASLVMNGLSGTLVPTVSLFGFSSGFSESLLLNTSVTGPGRSRPRSSFDTVQCDHLHAEKKALVLCTLGLMCVHVYMKTLETVKQLDIEEFLKMRKSLQ